MSQPNNSQNLYYPRGDGTNFGIYGTKPSNASKKSGSKVYNNHAKLIQGHLDEVKVVKVAGNPQNTSPMYEELEHYIEIEKIAKERQQLILAEIQSHASAFNGGSKRKTLRNKRRY